MKKIITIMSILIMLCGFSYAQDTVPQDSTKVKTFISNTMKPHTWMREELMKQGMVISLCTFQGLNGLVESHKFNGSHILGDDAYHAFRFAQSTSGIVAGYFMFANIQDKHKSWLTKTRHIIGAGCYGRDCFEILYRWNRSGNPFDYSLDNSWNRKAIVYFTFVDGKLVDAYISGGPVRGPIIDVGFAVAGWLLLR